ncbi:MAG: purine-nucleoside phosphorylase, partial [Coriobacteriia bacterium]|nr:purine-nucleoside phosphorylase [Coriobacteriia bacterium]
MTDETMSVVHEAADSLVALAAGLRPRVLVILGSGLGAVADGVETVATATFGELHGFASSNVPGHAGRFVFGMIGETPVMAMVGRLHLYEGHSSDRVVLPIRAARMLGCEVLIATNAAGGITPGLAVGQTMMVSDHINLLGANPLTGPNLDELGVRFPPMADAY